MRLATSRLTDIITVQPTGPDRDGIAIAPDATVDLDRVIGTAAEVRDAKRKVITPARPVTLGDALGPGLLRAFDIDPPPPARRPAADSGAAAPAQKKEK
jgi:hypothetical protein